MVGRDPAANERPSFSVVVPVLDEMPHLPLCLDGLRRAAREYPGVEMIFVDNGSRDGSYEYLRRSVDPTTTVLRFADVSIGAVRNAGAVRARGDYLCFVDADCVVCEDYFVRAAEVIVRLHPAATGSRVVVPPNATWLVRVWHDLHHTRHRGRVRHLNSGNLIVEREIFARLGGFDETLVTGEDADLCQRLDHAGHRLHQEPDIRSVHLDNSETLGAFFTKEVWHALGMHGTWRRDWLDRPTLMTLLYLLSLSLAGLAVAVLPLSVGGGLSLVTVALVGIPTFTVLYRWRQTGRRTPLLPSILLYGLYYLARAAGGARMILGTVLKPAKSRRRRFRDRTSNRIDPGKADR